MFCSKCGTELPDGSQFCSKCGTKLGDVSFTAASVDTNKVLKEGEFRYIVKLLDAMSKKNDGTLTLYYNRLEWKGGKEDFEILTDDIKTVKIKTVGSDSMLEISTNNGDSSKFLLMRDKPTGVDFLNTAIGGSKSTDTMFNSQMSNVRSQLESWRSAIDKVCGRL
jgi:hypothetical protein